MHGLCVLLISSLPCYISDAANTDESHSSIVFQSEPNTDTSRAVRRQERVALSPGTWGPQCGRRGGALTAAAGSRRRGGSEGPCGEASRESSVNY